MPCSDAHMPVSDRRWKLDLRLVDGRGAGGASFGSLKTSGGHALLYYSRRTGLYRTYVLKLGPCATHMPFWSVYIRASETRDGSGAVDHSLGRCRASNVAVPTERKGLI